MKFDKSLKILQVFLYLSMVFLWFKGNFPAFERIDISLLVPLIPLVLITVLRVYYRLRTRPVRMKFLGKKDIIFVLILIVAAISVRIPFLVYNFGLLDADDANAVLAGKHISEGKLAPIYHYGQFYLGTFNYHLYGIVFRMLGFSVLGALAVCLLIYLSFIVFQYFFFREIFISRAYAFVLAFFYCLPLGHLFSVSFQLGTSFPLVLLLGSLSLYLSYLIFMRGKEEAAPSLGFILGLLYWLHPSTVAFAVSAVFLVIIRFRMKLKKYVPFAVSAFVGGFPLILAEVSYGFVPFRSVFSGAKALILPKAKWVAAGQNVVHLMSLETNFLNGVIFFLLLLGIVTILVQSAKKKKFLPQNIFVFFFFIFMAVYLFSRYSEPGTTFIRYLYPLYIVLPVFLLGFFAGIPSRIKVSLSLLLLLGIVIFNNAQVTRANFMLVKNAHTHLSKIMAAIEKTGEKYWAGGFWQAHLLTALSGERIVGWPYNHEDYYPYGLDYLNSGENDNFVFFSEPGSFAVKFKETLPDIETALALDLERERNLVALLDDFHIDAKIEKISRSSWLIYDISVPVLPYAIEAPVPPRIPKITFVKGEASDGHLNLIFETTPVLEGFLFRLHAEIPGYSTKVIHLPHGKDEVRLRIPHPPKKSFPIKYYLDYRGLKIAGTTQEIICSLSDFELTAPREEILLLTGFGPPTRVSERRMTICEKDIVLEINKSLSDNTVCRMQLYSPIDFSHPFWYGKYNQAARIEVNGRYIKELRLKPGHNIIEFSLPFSLFPDDRNLIRIQFKYHYRYENNLLWKTAALLEKLEVTP